MIVKHVHGFWGAVRCWLKPCAVAVELQRRRDREIVAQRVEAFHQRDLRETERLKEWMKRERAEEW